MRQRSAVIIKETGRFMDSFLCGLQLAWELAYERNHFETNRHPSPAEETEMDA